MALLQSVAERGPDTPSGDLEAVLGRGLHPSECTQGCRGLWISLQQRNGGGGQYLWMGVSVKAGTPPHFSFAPQRPRLLPSNTASTPWECPKYAAKGTRSWGLVRGLDSLSGVPGVYDICDHTKHVPENRAVVGSDSQRGPGTGNPGRELPTVGPRRRSVRVRQSLLSCSRRRPTTTVRRSRDH